MPVPLNIDGALAAVLVDLKAGKVDVVIGTHRILSSEDVVDAYGHVSVRHPDRPDRYLLSRSLAPAPMIWPCSWPLPATSTMSPARSAQFMTAVWP